MSIFDVNKDGVVDYRDIGAGAANLFGLNQDGDGFFGSPGAGLIGALGQSILTDKAIKDIGQARQEANIFFGGQTDLPTFEGGLMGEIGRQSQFKPFTVRGPTVYGQPSTANISATGTDFSLSPEEAQLQRTLSGFGQQAFGFLSDPAQRAAEQSAVLQMLQGAGTDEQRALQSQLAGFGQQAFGFLSDPAQRAQEQASLIGMLTQDPSQRAAREQDIFNRLQAVQAPETERARLGLEERLFTQGRGGVRTAMFGGTPEQLALEKAIQEQQSRNAVSAMEQARAEQALQSQQTLQGLGETRARMGLAGQLGLAGIQESGAQQSRLAQQVLAGLGETRARMGLMGQLGLNAIPTAYTGQQQLISSLAPQLEASRLATVLQSTGLGLGAGIGESAIESQLGFEALRNALRQQQFQGLFELLGGQQTSQQPSSTGGVTVTIGG